MSAEWFATPDQMSAAAAYLAREWGHGPLIRQSSTRDVFDCRASDGAEWQIRADRWGNTYREDHYQAAASHAGLGVGHVWTRTLCPAYWSLDPKDCTCKGADA